MTGRNLLIHICCAPDATIPFQELLTEGYNVTGFMYGGNIHPVDEYARRCDALVRLTALLGERVVIMEWNPEQWLDATQEFATDPEGGARCRLCFELQLEAAAGYAAENKFTYLSTTLTISPHKDPKTINRIGRLAAEKYGLLWVDKIWRGNDGFKRSVTESKRLGLYRQNFCGCIYSERTVRDNRNHST